MTNFSSFVSRTSTSTCENPAANVKCVEGIVFSGAMLLTPLWHTTLTGHSSSVLKNGLTNSGLLEQIPNTGFSRKKDIRAGFSSCHRTTFLFSFSHRSKNFLSKNFSGLSNFSQHKCIISAS